MKQDTFVIFTHRFYLEFSLVQSHLKLVHYGLIPEQASWASPASGLFRAEIDKVLYDASTLILQDVVLNHQVQESQSCVFRFKSNGFELDHHLRWFEDTALFEQWQVIRNEGNKSQHVSRLDSFMLQLPPAAYELYYFDSDWGQEYELKQMPLTETITLETYVGRSSKGKHPWFALVNGNGEIFSGSVAWSGNWIIRFEVLAGGVIISGGLNNRHFTKELAPGQSVISPKAILVLGKDLNDVSQQYADIGRRQWYPHNNLSSKLPIEWNHWWSYEDREINETKFRKNIQAAAKLGIDICTLDAGWFGPDDYDADWYTHRGDWDHVNLARFPGGIRQLSEATHKHGMAFGLWCEIEGLGNAARLAQEHPNFVATRAGQSLGYICLGNPQARAWAYETLDRLITAYNLDWIKLDFNVDPGFGCDRTDHGHGNGDGLFEHYLGYYRVLDFLRETHPELILENCSSGGLRIDLGIMQHTHLTFLSDPDWPVHSLQVFWGASLMLAPEVCLHWSFSDWGRKHHPPQQDFNPHDSTLTVSQLDYYTRIAMLGVMGFSQKLDTLPDWVVRRLSHHIRIYRVHVHKFVREGILYHLTGQPKRDGTGDRWCAFQYSLQEMDQHLLFVFRLPGSKKERVIPLMSLRPDRIYNLGGFDGSPVVQLSGSRLMSPGLFIRGLLEEDSLLLLVHA
jgi:alpha-galactosidase